MKEFAKKNKLVVGVVALVILVAVFAGVWFATAPSTTEGAKEIAIAITHADGSVKELTLNTDQEYLRGALEDEALIAGSESEYGMYVLTVDGETADEANMEWWCFTAGGEMLMTSVDSTPIADGEAYEITLVVGW